MSSTTKPVNRAERRRAERQPSKVKLMLVLNPIREREIAVRTAKRRAANRVAKHSRRLNRGTK